MVLVILEKVLEAVYFSIFLIKGKDLKEKRLLFIGLMIFQYLALKIFIKYNIWFQISYIIITYIDLKVLYKEKAQITDIFLFMVASVILIILSIVSYIIVQKTINIYLVALILNRVLLFVILFLIRNKINIYYKKFYSLWNRHKNPDKIRSLTLRNISIIIFNLMFYIINICMIIAFNYYN